MKLQLDPTKRDGFGFCAELSGELVGRDEWGFPVLPGGDVPADLGAQAREAVRSCPRRALRLVP